MKILLTGITSSVYFQVYHMHYFLIYMIIVTSKNITDISSFIVLFEVLLLQITE